MDALRAQPAGGGVGVGGLEDEDVQALESREARGEPGDGAADGLGDPRQVLRGSLEGDALCVAREAVGIVVVDAAHELDEAAREVGVGVRLSSGTGKPGSPSMLVVFFSRR